MTNISRSIIRGNKELGFYYSDDKWKLFSRYFAVLQYVLGLTQRIQIIVFSWLMTYFQKQKWRTRSNLKCFESENNVRNCMGKCKSTKKKKKRKGFYGRSKKILYLPTLIYQLFIQDKFFHRNIWWRSNSWINITETEMK